MMQTRTWLEQPAYRWIREHLWHRPGDRLVYTVQASGSPERPEPPPVLGEDDDSFLAAQPRLETRDTEER